MKDGGPAFPVIDDERTRLPIYSTSGMTLRQWYAGMAMVGITASPKTVAKISPDEVAACAYEVADAMLAEREKGEAK